MVDQIGIAWHQVGLLQLRLRCPSRPCSHPTTAQQEEVPNGPLRAVHILTRR
ncbi:hypothetical protein Micbo1qcDRAFT_166503 [Microdochium bolleyi]|uniref:Uncharacterized protein n=1 Tax=Microdochium bolleyi TaxID=196109 RepID=A0A136IU64_9PEZI|nr:hypothetical protein Micbo1qcDRAFT_166503 [Microdochium bolleyi]